MSDLQDAPTILATFLADGLTPLEALTQPRRAEVTLRHDPTNPLPYLVTLISPTVSSPVERESFRIDHRWPFASLSEAQDCFDGLSSLNDEMRRERQRPPERHRGNGTEPWVVGDEATHSRLIPYETWRAQTQAPPPAKPAASNRSPLDIFEDVFGFRRFVSSDTQDVRANFSFFSFGN